MRVFRANNKYLKASKSYQRGESEALKLEAMKILEAREKQKVEKRKMRINKLNLFNFCTETVEWKGGGWIRDGVSPLRSGMIGKEEMKKEGS